MKQIFASASKIVFLLMAIATVVGMFLGKIEAKDFIALTLMAYTFYFTNKGNAENNYLGK